MSDILDQFRRDHPQYSTVGDSDLATGLYKYRDPQGHSYSDDMPLDEFTRRLGVTTSGQLGQNINPMAVVKPGDKASNLGKPVLPAKIAPPGPSDLGSGAAFVQGAIKGVPVVGPKVMDWVTDLASRFGSDPNAEPGQPGSPEELRGINALREHETEESHPFASGAGALTGGVAGYGTAAALAPELFGAGAASLPVRAGIAGATNAAIAGGDTAARGGKLPDIAQSAAIGGALGSAAPVAGRIVGAAVRPVARMFSNWFTPAVPGMRTTAANTLADALVKDSATANLPARAAQLGPEGRLADLSHSMKGWAQGLNDKYPEIENFLVARDKAAPGRILGDVDQAIGAAGNSPLKEKGLLDSQAKVEGQVLPLVFKQAPTVDASQALATIGLNLGKAVGPEETALKAARDYIQRAGSATAADAQTLHNAKTSISGLIEHGNEGLGIPKGSVAKAQGALKLVVGQVNQALRDQVPGYADAMDKIASLRRQAEQLKAGNEIFAKGNEPVHPQDLATEMAGLPPEEQTAKRFGARAAIDRKIRQNPNDRLALKQAIGGEGDFNRSNLETLFGKPAVGDLANTGEREAMFFDTKHRVVDNSETARRLAAEKMANPEQGASAHLGAGLAALHPEALPGYLALRAAQKSIGGIRGALLSGRNQDIAKALVRGDLPGLTGALLARGAARDAAGKPSAQVASDLARALLGYEGAVRKGQDVPAIAKGAAGLGLGATAIMNAHL